MLFLFFSISINIELYIFIKYYKYIIDSNLISLSVYELSHYISIFSY